MPESDSKNKLAQKELVEEISRSLAKRRETQRLSLSEVSQNCKIRVPIIKAMESGNWEELPSGVYLKGFLKKYASFLGLDADNLVDPYFRVSEVHHEEEEPEQDIHEEESQESNSRLVWIFIGLGVVFLMGLIKFLAVDYKKETSHPTQEGQEAIQPISLPETQKSPTPPPVQHTLTVFTPTPLWLRIEAEDKKFEGFIPLASTWSWTGAGQFSIRMGHVNDVVMTIDGQTVELTENQKRVYLPNEN